MIRHARGTRGCRDRCTVVTDSEAKVSAVVSCALESLQHAFSLTDQETHAALALLAKRARSALALAMAAHVRAERERAGLTQVELARLLPCAQSNIARLESGRHLIEQQTLDAITKACYAHASKTRSVERR